LDSSYYEEIVTYSEHRVFRLLKYHVTQKGPSFNRPLEFSLDSTTGESTVHYTDHDGKERVETERIQVRPDFANGMVTTLVKDIQPNSAESRLSMIVATPKPRLVRLLISKDGEDWFSIGHAKHKAIRYRVKFDIAGVAGAFAPLVGKEPPDLYIWVLNGDAPTFLKSEGQLYSGGPIWRIELVSPTWQEP
jgi:hypothetical protein